MTREEKLALDSLTVRRRMMSDCFAITRGARQRYYAAEIGRIDRELAELDDDAHNDGPEPAEASRD